MTSTQLGRAPTRRREVIVGIVLGAVVILGAAVLLGITALQPRPWTLRPFEFAASGEGLEPVAWSPDGTRLIFTNLLDRFVVIRVSDGAQLADLPGSSPVWVDDETIDALVGAGGDQWQLHRIELGSGGPTDTAMPTAFPPARLVGHGADLAATETIGSIWTTIVDPATGGIVAKLDGVRAIRWAAPGTLILKTTMIGAAHMGSSPGQLRVWTSAGGLRPIGGDLVEIWDDVSPSPDGDAIACVCVGPDDHPTALGRMELVPLDGSAPKTLGPIAAGRYQTDPVAHWLDADTIVFLDGSGLHGVHRNGLPFPVAAVDPADLPADQYHGRAGILDGRIFISGQDKQDGDEIAGRLTLRRPDGTVEFATTTTSMNGLVVLPDPTAKRALVVADPQQPDQPAVQYLMLSRG